MDLTEKLTTLIDRANTLTEALTVPQSPEEFVKLSKELGTLEPIVAVAKDYQNTLKNKEEAGAMLNDDTLDKDMKELANEEFYAAKEKLEKLEQQLKILLLPKDEADEKNAMLEVRAGTGGEEASLFAAELFRMYERYAALRGWTFETISYTDTGLGGCKEAVARISGNSVFARLKFESGVHRVQRVPETESGGRLHTSAATVAILPEASEFDIVINPDDLEISTCRSSGAGGQHVNTTDSAIRIVHKPTGVVVECQEERSQFKNRDKAMLRLRTILYNKKRQEEQDALSASRKTQVGSGDRSERIRTYNFPQGRVTDHRINKTVYQIESVMQGELDEFIEALIEDDQLKRLAEID